MRLHPLFLLGALMGAFSFGQVGLATLTGTVTDQSGAVMTEVAVSARHLATGTTLSAASSATGNFNISNMPIGQYEIVVEQPGFKTYRREGLTMQAQQTLRLSVVMEVGAPAESVTVTAEASLLKTDSGEVVHTVTMKEIQDLPLTPVTGFIRDPLNVARLLPGVSYIANSFMIVNGLPADAVQYRIDGQVMGNSRGGFGPITTNVQPSVDAIEQVAVQTSNFSAEFGSVAGALFSLNMRSGTNRYSGSVYDYAVNEVLNAHDPSVHRRNQVRRHDWGGTFGGPINIPKIYQGRNKSFFFFSWELYNQSQINRVTANQPTVPIQAYRDGDYSRLIQLSGNRSLTVGTGAAARPYLDPLGNQVLAGTIFDARSAQQIPCNPAVSQDCGGAGNISEYRSAFPGNRVPVNLMDPVALAIQSKYIPLPLGPRAANNEVINNYENPFATTRLSIIPSIKIDHNINSKSRFSLYWQMNRTESPLSIGAEGFNDTITGALGTFETNRTARLNYDMTLRPTLQLHLGAGWTQFDWSNASPVIDYNPAADIGLRGVRQDRNFPRFGANTQTTAGFVGLGGMSAMGPTSQGLNPERRPSGNASLTWIHKNHNIKYGADWRMDVLPTLTYTNTAGNFSALGNGITYQTALIGGPVLSGNANLGFPYAEFLLGSVRGFTMSTPIAYRTSKQQWGMYLQDSWRARRNLTLDFGLRWDYGTYTREDHGRNAGLSLTEPNPSAAGRAGALIYEATCKCKFAENYPFAIGPRLGFAYTLNPRTVFRGGFGVAYGSTSSFGGFTQNSASAPANVTGQDNFKLRDGIPASINPQWPVFEANLGHTVGTVQGAQALLDPNAGRPSRTYQWNVSLQREITRNLVVEASYVGNRGIWQSAGGMVSHNAVSERLLAQYGFKVGNADDNALLNQRLDRLSAAQQATLRARNVVLPYSNFPLTQTVFQSLRPFPQYTGGISPSSAPLGRSWYDSLQTTLTKRYSHGLSVSANYTFTKNLSARSLPDVFNRSYGNKDIDGSSLPHLLRLTFQYETPRPSSSIPVLGQRYVAWALGGWGLAIQVRYQSGFLVGRPDNGAASPISRWLQRGPGGAQLKRNSDGSFMNPWAVNWTDYDGKIHAEPINVNCKCYDPEKTLVLNPAVWDSVPDAQWAADAQRLPFFRGIRQPQEAGNVSRTFRFGPDKRVGLQVRMEFQNMFNRLLLPSAPTLGNFTATVTPGNDGRYTSGFGSFGNLRAAGAYGAERTGMLVGRLTF